MKKKIVFYRICIKRNEVPPSPKTQNKYNNMKLITIAVIALVGFYSAQAAQAAPPEKKGDTDATLAIVVEKTSKLKESVDKAKTSLGKATQTSAETLAQFDQAIATAKLVLDKMGENGEVAKLIDDAIKVLVQRNRQNWNLQSKN